DHDDHDEESVFARVKQDRWQALLNYSLHNDYIENISVKAGFTDYEHSEIEGGMIGTTFKNKTTELRTNIEHRLGEWHGIVGYHFASSDYEAQGEEAFTPATDTTSHAIYLLEEKQLGNLTLELGARLEDYLLESVITEKHHDEHEEDHDHHEEEHHELSTLAYELSQTNVSFSIGGVYDYSEGQNIAINLSHSERSPLTAELLSNGVHIATSTYELGLGYHLEDGEVHFEPENIEQEIATNFDVSFRKFSGKFGYTVNFFYNDVENYYYQENTGLIYSAEHGIEEADHEHEGALPVYQFQSQDAYLYGLELDAHYNVNANNTVKFFADSITAKLKDDGYLPRIPNNKFGVNYEYTRGKLVTDLTITHYASQDNITAYETTTDSYTLIDLSMQYDLALAGVDMLTYLNIDNITDELGFVHSSVIKEQAPLPGRNIRFGVKAFF
ncbi:TonB-dependent receptor, partial [Pseudoalteromonas phenolica]